MDKFKLASSSFGERLKTGGAQMGRLVSTKMKEILQSPTPESKMVDDATSENMEEPNWGMNLRICAMINSEEFSGTEIVKAIKKKLSAKSPVTQRLSLDLLETCSSNCEKVFSEVASEKVLDEMVRVINDPRTDHAIGDRAFQLIRAWGESEDLKYLPVFHQTYMSLQSTLNDPPEMQHTLESYIHQQPISAPERYPIPDAGLDSPDHAGYNPFGYVDQSVEEKREFLVITRNSLELLSSILNSETNANSIKDEITVSLLENCKQSQPVVQRMVETTTEDESMLFEALNLHDELRQTISKYEELEATALASGTTRELPENSDSTVVVVNSPPVEEAKTSHMEAKEEEPKTSHMKTEEEETKTESSREETKNSPSSSSEGLAIKSVSGKDKPSTE